MATQVDRSRCIKINQKSVVVVMSFGSSFKRLMSTVGTTVTQRPLSPLWRPKRAVGQTPPPPFFDCKHPADFKRTAVSGRKAAGAILAVLMSTTGENTLGEIT